ncbi:MAG: hypothetical protein Q8P34_11130, partial [Bacteroidota bacterium]|nr:hypothetical protein [Bacteroidota bacterium]
MGALTFLGLLLPDGLPDATNHTWPRQIREGFLPSLGSLPEPDHIQAASFLHETKVDFNFPTPEVSLQNIFNV